MSDGLVIQNAQSIMTLCMIEKSENYQTGGTPCKKNQNGKDVVLHARKTR
jgi:hypothetical protein